MRGLAEYFFGCCLIVGGLIYLGLSKEPAALLPIIGGLGTVALSGRNLP